MTSEITELVHSLKPDASKAELLSLVREVLRAASTLVPVSEKQDAATQLAWRYMLDKLLEIEWSFKLRKCDHCDEQSDPVNDKSKWFGIDEGPRSNNVWMHPNPIVEQEAIHIHGVAHLWRPSCELRPFCRFLRTPVPARWFKPGPTTVPASAVKPGPTTVPASTLGGPGPSPSSPEFGWLADGAKHYHVDIGWPDWFDPERYFRTLPDKLIPSAHYQKQVESRGLPQYVYKGDVLDGYVVSMTEVGGAVQRLLIRIPWTPDDDLSVSIDVRTGTLITGYFNNAADWHRLVGDVEYTDPKEAS